MKTVMTMPKAKKDKTQKTVWVDGRELLEKTGTLLHIYHLNFTSMLIRRSDLGKFKAPACMKFIIEISSKEDLKDIPEQSIVFSKQPALLTEAASKGYRTAILCQIEDANSMNFAWSEGMKYDFLVAEFTSETNIPLELLIARLQPTNTILIKKIKSVQEAEIVFGVMEAGSDGVLFGGGQLNDFSGLDQIVQKEKSGKLKLVKAIVTKVQHAGMGYRACIDTTHLFNQKEGMIIGSTSEGGLLVSSETHYLPYMELRPFRVNAGSVHSYVWCPEDKTAYITELSGGSKVLCVDTEGNTREVVVGRMKTEIRPLLKIEVEAEGKKINAFVQDDWHIRIFGAKGEPLNASCIKEGDELLAYVCDSGRHVGIKIDENIEEK